MEHLEIATRSYFGLEIKKKGGDPRILVVLILLRPSCSRYYRIYNILHPSFYPPYLTNGFTRETSQLSQIRNFRLLQLNLDKFYRYPHAH